MNAHLVFTVVTILSLTAIQSAHAWNESGHLQIAAIAYGELSSTERAFIDTILEKHEKYPTWKTEHDTYRANTSDNREVSLGFYVFTRAAVWPDEIRDYDKPETHAYWHFITYPLKSPGYSFRTELMPATNVVVGIEASVDFIEDEHNSGQTRAEYLSFLIHLVGDIHQPHHCGSLFNSRFTQKDGDKGGNRFYVKETANGSKKKLHSLWDGLLGSGDDPDNVKDSATALTSDHPRSSFTTQLSVTDAREWSKVSRKNAIDQSYKKFSSVTPTSSNPVLLPQGYKAEAKVVAREYATLAGYRLADMIKELAASNP